MARRSFNKLCSAVLLLSLHAFAANASPMISTTTTPPTRACPAKSPSSSSSSPSSSLSSTSTAPAAPTPTFADLSKAVVTNGNVDTVDGQTVVSLTPPAGGSASVELPPGSLPAQTPGSQVSVQVGYQAEQPTQLQVRDESLQCTLTIVLDGAVIYSALINTTDGNYTTVQASASASGESSTLIITETCPPSASQALSIGSVSLGPISSTLSTASIPLETTSLPPSSATSAAPSTTPVSATSTSTTSTAPVQTTTAPLGASTTISAPPFTTGTCSLPTGAWYTNPCTISGYPTPTGTAPLVAATGVPIPTGSSDEDEYETCAGLCASVSGCQSWVLDRGSSFPWMSPSLPWTCYLYAFDAADYLGTAVSSSSSNRYVWMSNLCYSCETEPVLPPVPSSAGAAPSSSTTPSTSTAPGTTTTTPHPTAATSSKSKLPTTTHAETTVIGLLPSSGLGNLLTTELSTATSPTAVVSSPTTTSSNPPFASATFAATTCTRAASPAPSLACDVQGFAQPGTAAVSVAATVQTETDCAAYCASQNAAAAGSCASFMWMPDSLWCGTYNVSTWAAIGEVAVAGSLYASNVMDDFGCWDC